MVSKDLTIEFGPSTPKLRHASLFSTFGKNIGFEGRVLPAYRKTFGRLPLNPPRGGYYKFKPW